MYYKDVEEEMYNAPYKGNSEYSIESLQDYMDWFKTPIGITVIVIIVAIIAFLIWWFLIREPGNKGFKYY